MRTRDLKKLKSGTKVNTKAVSHWLPWKNAYIHKVSDVGTGVRSSRKLNKSTQFSFLYAREITGVANENT